MTAATVEGAGVALAVEERGHGEPIVFVHGIATDRTVWRETLEALGDGVRGIAYDRRAYGDSGAPEPYGGTTVGEQADDLAALIRSLDVAPATLCGCGFGALISLDVMMRHRDLARGAVLIEPPMLWLSPGGSEAMSKLREAVEKGAREGGGTGAVDAYLGDARAALGAERTGAARMAVRGFAADLGAVASWAAGRRELRRIEQPAILIAGTRSPPVIDEVARAIAGLLPHCELVELDAGHFVQLEQPVAVAEAIRRIASA
jgi:pimeloyl-ACP methyl ester carboxylesterase